MRRIVAATVLLLAVGVGITLTYSMPPLAPSGHSAGSVLAVQGRVERLAHALEGDFLDGSLLPGAGKLETIEARTKEVDDLANEAWRALVEARQGWIDRPLPSSYETYLSASYALSAADTLSMVPRSYRKSYIRDARAQLASSKSHASFARIEATREGTAL